MRSFIDKVSSTTLYVLLGISVVVVAIFFAGGVVDPAAEMKEPVYTEILLYWMYVLLGLGVAAALVFGIYHFGMTLKDHPKAALKQIATLVGFVLILVVAWSLGSGTPLQMTGYDGTENVYFWLKLTDMFLYTIYLLLGVAIVAIVASNVKKMINK